MSDEERSKPDAEPYANGEELQVSGSPAISFSPTAISPRPKSSFRRIGLPLVMFVLTCLSTVLAGMAVPPVSSTFPPAPPTPLQWIFSACTYAAAVLGILLFHEFGHYLQSVRYGVRTSLPYFLPMPIISPFGTLGAVILQDSRSADRRQLFDIAITGPLAGLLLAIPIAWCGSLNATIIPGSQASGWYYVDPPILKWMFRLAHPEMLPGDDVILNPLLFAGWVGIFVTSLNLIPIGQMDGGHLVYALLGKQAHVVSGIAIGAALGFMLYTGDFTFSLMLVLIVAVGWRHPPTANDRVPLGWRRVLLGWSTLAFLLVGFTPTPIKWIAPTVRPPIVVPRDDDLLVDGTVLADFQVAFVSPVAASTLAKGCG
jgi:membrane-associated protease RseP (regulator of RpoE activity)